MNFGSEHNNLASLMHELKHVCEGHRESYNALWYLFWYEPTAVMHVIRGPKK